MIIVCDRPRQLGNRLFVFAHLIAFAKENNIQLNNLSFAEYAKYFINTKEDLFCRFPLKKTWLTNNTVRKFFYESLFLAERIFFRGKLKTNWLKSFRIEEEDENNKELNQQFIDAAKTTSLVIFQGWGFRDYISFEKNKEWLKMFFTPLKIHQNKVGQLIYKVKVKTEMLVGIHIRQKDYKKHFGGKFFYSTQQYKLKMREVLQVFPNEKIRFLICSDEKQNENDFKEFDFIFGTGHFIEDLYAFAKCDYLLAPPSTYTMWASFYGNVPLCILENINLPITIEGFKVHSE